jgi:hypothetical protein
MEPTDHQFMINTTPHLLAHQEPFAQSSSSHRKPSSTEGQYIMEQQSQPYRTHLPNVRPGESFDSKAGDDLRRLNPVAKTPAWVKERDKSKEVEKPKRR